MSSSTWEIASCWLSEFTHASERALARRSILSKEHTYSAGSPWATPGTKYRESSNCAGVCVVCGLGSGVCGVWSQSSVPSCVGSRCSRLALAHYSHVPVAGWVTSRMRLRAVPWKGREGISNQRRIIESRYAQRCDRIARSVYRTVYGTVRYPPRGTGSRSAVIKACTYREPVKSRCR